MNIENIEAFVYVTHYGSFNKAAEILFLSQPSVTARIQSLERELDCKLFDRLGKQIQLTEEGKRFLPYSQQILHTLQKGKLNLHQQKALPNELRIGSTVSVANYVLPLWLPALMKRYPDIHFKLVTASTDELVTKVLNKELDIGFVRNTSHPGLRSVSLYEDPIRLHVYDGHPFTQEQNVEIERIGDYPFVFFECGALDWIRIHRLFEGLEKPPAMIFQSDNLETAKKLVLEKASIAFLPSLCASDEVSRGLLHPIDFPEAEGISLKTNMIALSGETNPFFDTLLELSKKLPSAVSA
ncbi:LysR family transcriptional regulator [Paenibacillus sp. NPDC058071]|uniref:LysR family transcriptional regulator n=1 Tax=Paenibacillus sp. NPDC058071 TaxID=3346326 RepID=UPI0036D86855